MRREIKLSI